MAGVSFSMLSLVFKPLLKRNPKMAEPSETPWHTCDGTPTPARVVSSDPLHLHTLDVVILRCSTPQTQHDYGRRHVMLRVMLHATPCSAMSDMCSFQGLRRLPRIGGGWRVPGPLGGWGH